MFVFLIVEVRYVFQDFFEDRQRACSQSLRETLTVHTKCETFFFFSITVNYPDQMVSVHRRPPPCFE